MVEKKHEVNHHESEGTPICVSVLRACGMEAIMAIHSAAESMPPYLLESLLSAMYLYPNLFYTTARNPKQTNLSRQADDISSEITEFFT